MIRTLLSNPHIQDTNDEGPLASISSEAGCPHRIAAPASKKWQVIFIECYFMYFSKIENSSSGGSSMRRKSGTTYQLALTVYISHEASSPDCFASSDRDSLRSSQDGNHGITRIPFVVHIRDRAICIAGSLLLPSLSRRAPPRHLDVGYSSSTSHRSANRRGNFR